MIFIHRIQCKREKWGKKCLEKVPVQGTGRRLMAKVLNFMFFLEPLLDPDANIRLRFSDFSSLEDADKAGDRP